MTSPSFTLAGRAAALALLVLLMPAAALAQANRPYDPAGAAGVSLRLSTLEEQIRQLNGQIEQLGFQLRQLQDQMRRMSEDTEYRFQELGQAGTAPRPQTAIPSTPGQATPEEVAPGPAPIGQSVAGARPPGPGAPPQVLGQVPGRPLDLSAALGQPTPDPRHPDQDFRAPNFETPQGPQLVMAPSGDPKDAYDLAYGYILRGDFQMAEASFRDFLNRHPGDPLAGNAQYWLGESLYARGQYRAAADAFLKGYTDYPKSAKAPDSLYKLGMSLKELGQAEAACSTFAEITRRYPQASQAVLERARSEMQKSGC